MNTLPRSEYPRPQFVRDSWINLNGEWQFERDRAVSGEARQLYNAESSSDKIIVPFCMESKLSGIGDTDFCNCVWYKKKTDIPSKWLERGKKVLLHIGACNYKTTLYVNGIKAGTHIGGYVSFSFDITDFVTAGENILTISAETDVRAGKQASGKQSQRYESYGCYYTRTTGIWQTVWLENVAEKYIESAKYYPDINDSTLTVIAKSKCADGYTVSAQASFGGKTVGADSATVCGGIAILKIKLDELHLWDIGKGELYDITLTLGEDTVKSYFGLRSVQLDGYRFLLNGKSVFQRLVLDQGFYPDGIITASCDEELLNDIKRSIAMGFDGARLHQKIFEERFLYYCDKMGYIVWGEHANWGMKAINKETYQQFSAEWTEALERDFNHPAIIGWCPLNETAVGQDDDSVVALSMLTRALDPTRPIIDSSGWIHAKGAVCDIMDWHDYDQNPETFNSRYQAIANGTPLSEVCLAGVKHWLPTFPIFPMFMSEYGGIKWDINSNLSKAWGYGNAPKTEEEFKERFKALTEALLFNKFMTGLCYTQLTDVEQEVNGLYTYDRQAKFDPEFFRNVLQQKAASEE